MQIQIPKKMKKMNTMFIIRKMKLLRLHQKVDLSGYLMYIDK